MSDTLEVDLCVIGGGTGGLVVAAGASQMGARTVLIEHRRMGGDCLNYGCVPSKSMLSAAEVAQTMRDAGNFGIVAVEPQVDFARVQAYVQSVISAIAPHDSVERFTKLGVQVIQARGHFAAPDEVRADQIAVRARRFVVATGSSPMVPPIPGLDQVEYLTNETVFENRVLPAHLVVIGGGPVGLELAQAHRRFGARVTVIEAAGILNKDDPELVGFVKSNLEREGVVIRERVRVATVGRTDRGIEILLEDSGRQEAIEASHLLIATGRKPSVDDLGLEAAGVTYSPKGIEVDSRLRTSNRRVYAVGDVTGGPPFTHMAAHQASVVLRNALFRLPAAVEQRAVPWVTYTDPELAHVGMTEALAAGERKLSQVLRFSVGENDRAKTGHAPEGMIKVVLGKGGRVLGASIAAPHAGELILPWVMAVRQRMKVGTLASIIVPYPTLSEISKSVAGTYYTPKLFSPMTRKLVRFLGRFG